MIPGHLHPLFPAARIREEISRLGREISAWARDVRRDTGSDPIALPVMRGGIFFFADLARAVQASLEIGIVHTRTYVEGENQVLRGGVEIELPRTDVSGRAVLVADDICDTGVTLDALTSKLRSLGASDVKTAVLITRAVPDAKFKPDWSAFHYSGPEWIAGYGMEDGNRWRNLPDTYLIRQP